VLGSAGITAKPGKSQWGGHIIGCGSLAISEQRVTAVCDYKCPMNKKEVRAFLGLLGYYWKFIPKFADQSFVLSPATSKTVPGIVVWIPIFVC